MRRNFAKLFWNFGDISYPPVSQAKVWLATNIYCKVKERGVSEKKNDTYEGERGRAIAKSKCSDH
jgi:hypothetical protein